MLLRQRSNIFLSKITAGFIPRASLYLLLPCLMISQVNAQTCSGAADMWYANDESGSVSNAEMTQALDFLYQVADGFVFDDISGAKAGVFGWSNNLSPAQYIIPASDTFSDKDDTGFLDPNRDGSTADNNIFLDNDGTGIRELYPTRTYSSGTWLAAATDELASLIGSVTDTDFDGVTDNGRRTGVPQIAVLLTDATASQLKNAGSGGGAGQEGGSDWDGAMADLLVAGPDGTNIVLMLIDVAAVAYGTPGAGNEGTAGDAAVRMLVDSFVTNYGVTLYVGGTYAEIADPVNSFVDGLVNAVCDLADIALYLKNQPATYNPSTVSFSVTFEFSDDVTGFALADINVGGGSPSNLIQVSPSIYTADITPDGSTNDITVDVAVNAAQSDPDGKPTRPAAQGITQYDGDSDGIGDTSEGTTTDSDGDSVFDNVDLDSDNDGIPDAIENNASGAVDTDGDTIPDYLDLDSDNDGILDIVEGGSAIALGLDTTGGQNGQIDLANAVGADGLADALQTGGDGGALNYTVADSDSDSIVDFRDLDSDNDSLSDLIESGILLTTVATLDADDDGDIDSPSENAANTVGTDGIVDSLQSNIDGDSISHTVSNVDNDALRDALDLDTDNDGIPDLIEGGNTAAVALDANNDGRLQPGESAVSGDGIADGAQGGADGGALPAITNSDSANETGPAIPDFRDLDSDNDGIFDSRESGGTDSNIDAIADGTDTNNDGMIDSGFVVNPLDSAPTDTPDYQNPDSNAGAAGDDNDSDAVAGPLDSSPNDGVIDNTTDSDADGIPDSRDDLAGPGALPEAKILIVESAAATQVNESGAGVTDSFTVALQRPPTSNVVINVSSPDTGEATISPSVLTFTPGDWDIPQAVTVTGAADNFVDGDMAINLSVLVDNALSANEYDGLSDSVIATVVDTTPDSDGDGVSDAAEGTGDADGDGIDNANDSDSDNDGIADSVEAGLDPENIPDTDGDGILNTQDRDSDNDGILDVLEVGPTPNSPLDSDNDGIADYLDGDADNDGIPDTLEDSNTPTLSGVDTQGGSPGGNGIDDNVDVAVTLGLDANSNGVDDLFEPSNTDADLLGNQLDLDSDGDGILDIIEADNVPAFANNDSDNDGIDDAFDADEFVTPTDVNGNGIQDSTEPRDTDGDGTPDYLDIDSDNDSIPDSVEAAPSAGSLPTLSGNDTDSDGIDDAIDADNGGSAIDLNSNGISDIGEPENTDGDGVPDYRDLDSDNDSLSDIAESGTADNNADGLIDSVSDEGTQTVPANSDGDLIPDYRDLESTDNSNDGSAPFDIDSNPDATGLDVAPQDGEIDNNTDTDGDGIPDNNDDAVGPGVQPASDILVTVSGADNRVNEDGAGNTDTFTVVLQRQPLSDVVLNLSSADTGETVVSLSTLTFTNADWDIPQAVTVTGVADDFIDGDLLVNINIEVDDALSSNEYDTLSTVTQVVVVDTTPDADGDGLSDVAEGTNDTDGDGITDNNDADSDNDGVPDSVEAGNDPETIPDSDNDGLPDYRDLDADNDNIVDAIEIGPTPFIPLDTDNDGTPDYIDSDSDNDRIPDIVEDTNSPILSGIDTVGSAPDVGNGIDDTVDFLATGGVDGNSNGVDDALEPANADAAAATGSDSLPNHLDLDSDGDGILDIIEADNVPAYLNIDTDSDGIDDAIDVDITLGEDMNNNGIDDALEPRDTDADGRPDYLDIDSDNDSIPDSVEAAISGGSLPVLSGVDTDSDGIDDNVDSNNGGPVTDVNANGISDNGEPVDTDGDGVPDYRDLDSDNDSLLDIDEAGTNDLNLDGQVDNSLDEGSVSNPPNNDIDIDPDYRDLDSNMDGTFDLESNPDAIPFDTAPQDGEVDVVTDNDGDGIANDVDLDPDNFGGGRDSDEDMIPDVLDLDDDNDGIPDLAEGLDELDPANSTDTDMDGIPDYLDLDSDNDGLYDVVEASASATDTNQDGQVDGFIDNLPAAPMEDGLHDPISAAFTPLDSDDDGIPDFRDLDSDGDTLTDLLESVANQAQLDASDGDGDGVVDAIDPITGIALNPLVALDNDGDGIANFRDQDSDGDGFSDLLEASDSNGNGVFDSQEAGTGTLRTSVSGGGGSMGIVSLLVMLVAVLRKTVPTLFRSHARFGCSAFALCTLLTLSGLGAQNTYAESNCSKLGGISSDKNAFVDCWYAGAGLSLSHVDPEGASNGWRTDDDSSTGWELTLGKHFKPHWFAELKYADLGEAGLGNEVAVIDAAFNEATISYQVPSLMAGYFLRDVRDNNKRWNIYGKAGIAWIKNAVHADGGTVGFREVTSSQFSLGVGAQYQFKTAPWFMRLNYDRYDRDAWAISLSASRYFNFRQH